MAKKYREWYKMGMRVKAELIKRATILAEDAMIYAFEKGFASKERSSTSRKYEKGDKKAWTDITYNLRDSFASAVYVDGQLLENTVRYIEPEPRAKDTRLSGRHTVDAYLHSIHPFAGKDMIGIVVVAAMKYTKYLESGQHHGGYKIKVVSGATDYINAHYGEMVNGIYKRWNVKRPFIKTVKGWQQDPAYK